MTHSPAPWTMSGDLIVGAPEPRPNPKAQHEGRAIAKLCWDFDGDTGANGDLPWAIAKANGQLMIAAPELLEALRECITDDAATCAKLGSPKLLARRLSAINNIARAAINKAIEG